MTPTDRIERAARARYERDHGVTSGGWSWDGLTLSTRARLMGEMKSDFAAAYPELFSDPPSHWIAPMEATDEMFVAFVESEVSFCEEHDTYENAARFGWRAMRDAHLKEQGE